MGKNFTPEYVGSGFNTTHSLNTNFSNIEKALDDSLSRSGAAPNGMLANLDMNDHDIINTGLVDTSDLLVDGRPVPSLKDIQDLWERFLREPKIISGEYTITEDDRFLLLICTSATVLTLPSDVEELLPSGWYCYVVKATDERVQFTSNASISAVDNSTEILEENSMCAAIKTQSDQWLLIGNMA